LNPPIAHLRIFLSSPGDVAHERSIALEVIDKLPYDPGLGGKVALKSVAWDQPGAKTAMLASLTPQEAVDKGLPKPSECDIVVVILWARMGTPLPYPKYQKADGSPYLSGTEWEFEDAIQAAEKAGRPFVVVYRCTQDPTISLDDPELDKKREQRQRVQAFFDGFKDSRTGALIRGVNEYQTPDEFRELLSYHLEDLILRYLKEIPPPEDESPIPAAVEKADIWHGEPYPGLRAFRTDEAPIFYGRGRETDDLLKRVDDSRFVAVAGPSGAGKSSLVRAGLIPRLKDNAIEGSKDWHVVVFRPGEAGPNPFEALAVALLKQFPVLESQTPTVSALAQALSHSSQALADSCAVVLKDEEREWVKILFFIDQFEELLTVAGEADRARFGDMLVHAATVDRIRVIVTLRADFYQQMLEEQPLVRLLQRSLYSLSAPGEIALRDMVVGPARRARVRFEDGLPEQIVHDTGTAPGALALLAYALNELYEAARHNKDMTITHKLYADRGGVQGMIGKKAEESFQAQDEKTRAALPPILRELVTVNDQGIAARKRADLEAVTRAEGASALVNTLTQARLIVQDEKTVQLAHDALLSKWPRLQNWLNIDRGFLIWRERLQPVLAEWERDPSMLLRGLPLQEAEQWLATRGADLTDTERAYIRASITEHERQMLQQRRVKWAVRLFGLIVLVVAVALVYFLFAQDYIADERLRRKARSAGDLLAVMGLDVEFERYEVTNSRYKRCVDAGTCTPPAVADYTFSTNAYYTSGSGDQPIYGVDAVQADIFCKWIGRRLPALAEWRTAATNAHTTTWPWGNEAPTPARAKLVYESPEGDPFAGKPDEVGTHPAGASGDGIEDLIGNVFEWTASIPAEDIEQAATWAGWDDSNVPSELYIVGGSYASSPSSLQNYLFVPVPGGSRSKDWGFRCVE
jgi:hypothetical protein